VLIWARSSRHYEMKISTSTSSALPRRGARAERSAPGPFSALNAREAVGRHASELDQSRVQTH
jgi:hypothetical protein